MNKIFATKEKIDLLRHEFFQHLVAEIQSPLDLLQEYQSGLLGHHGKVSPHLKYPLVLQEYVALLQNAEARFVLQRLADSSDTLLIWNSYASYGSITLTEYILTKPDSDTDFAFILHESESSGLIWLDYSKAKTGHSADDATMLSIESLCKDLNI